MKKKLLAMCVAGTFLITSFNSVCIYADESTSAYAERYTVLYQNDFDDYNITTEKKNFGFNYGIGYTVGGNGIINGDVYQGNFAINRFTTKVDPTDTADVQGTPNDPKNWVYPDHLITDETHKDYGFYGVIRDNDTHKGFWSAGKNNLDVVTDGTNQYLQMGKFYMAKNTHIAASLVRNNIDMSESVVWESKINFANDGDYAKDLEYVKLEIAEAGSLVYNDSAKTTTLNNNLNAASYAVLTFNNGDVYLGERNGHVSDKFNADFEDEGFMLTTDSNKLESGKWYTVRYVLDNSNADKRYHSVIIKDAEGNEVINSGMRELKLDTSEAVQGTQVFNDWNARINKSCFTFDEGKADKGFILTVMNSAAYSESSAKNEQNKFWIDDYKISKQSGLKVTGIDEEVEYAAGSAFETVFNYELDGEGKDVSEWIWLTDNEGTKVTGTASWNSAAPQKLTYTLGETLAQGTTYNVHFSSEITEKQDGLYLSSENGTIKTTGTPAVPEEPDTERYTVQYKNDFEKYNLTTVLKEYKYNWLGGNGIVNGDEYQGNFAINRFTTKVDLADDESVQGTPNDTKNWVFPDYLINDESHEDYGFYGAVEDNDKKAGTFWMAGKYNLNVMKSGSNKYLKMGDFYMLGKPDSLDYVAAYLVRNGIDMSESVVWESKINFDNADDGAAAKEAEVVKLEIAEASSLVYNDANKTSTIPDNLNAGAYAVLTFNNGDVYLGERNGHVSDKYNSEFVDEGFKLTTDSNKLESGKWYTVRYVLDNSGDVKRHSVIIKDADGNVVIDSGLRELKLDTSKGIQGTYFDKDWNARVNRSWFSFDENKPDKGFILTVMNMADNKLGSHQGGKNKFYIDDYTVYKQSGLKVTAIDKNLRFINGSAFETKFNYELDGTKEGIEDWIWLTDEDGRKIAGTASWNSSAPKKLTYTLEEELKPNTYYDVHFSPEITEKQDGLYISSKTEKIKTTDATVIEGEITYDSPSAVMGNATIRINNLIENTVSGRVIAFIRNNGVIYDGKIYSLKINGLGQGNSGDKLISNIDLPTDKSNAELVVYLWNEDGSEALTEGFSKKLTN